MKNNKRAYRRFMKHVKFMKRVKIWFSGPDHSNTKEYYKDLTLKGKHFTFLKTTSTPCSCSSCAYYKYERTQKQYRVKEE